jgi:hypothetical protein
MIKVYPISQLLCDLEDEYTLSSSEIADLRDRVTVSIFSGQVNVYNCGRLIMDPRPISITWDAIDNPSYISSDEINKLLSNWLPTYFWNPQRQIPKRGAPKSESSLEAHVNSGHLKVEATKCAKKFIDDLGRIPTRLDVANKLVVGVYKSHGWAPRTLKGSLKRSWWPKKVV